MQSSNCIKEASKACFSSCCTNPLHVAPPTAAATPRRDFVSAILSTLHPNTSFTNHESLPSLRELLSSLRDAVPNYFNTVLADSIRAQEYHHFNLSNHVCLDYVGHGLFSYAQKSADERFFDFSYSSTNFTSYLLYGAEETEFQAAAKQRIFKYMNLSEDDYSLVFTANQSSSFNLLGHSYPFDSHQNLVTVYDCDNEALQLMIDAARKRSARPQSAVFSWPSLRVNSRKLRKILMSKNRGLLVFPLQSRMSGARYSYQWMNLARENGWHVLLDASALAPKEMETLGLSLFHPDFLISSFFNIFGHNPSGFCCLFVKKSSVSLLTQSSTNMGIINLVPPKLHAESSSSSSEERSKAPLLSEIVEVDRNQEKKCEAIEFRGLDNADTLGLILISSRLRYLVNWLVNALLSLRHPHSGNGVPLVTVYGPRIRLDRGPAIAFNVCDWKGERVEPLLVQKLADRNNISLSLGLLKNVCFTGTMGKDKEKKKSSRGDRGVGMVSASLGMLTNFEDVYRLWAFVSRFLDADFVEKEKWRYTALNQTTVEV
ncbi:molybdenum cofactor sulfurase-like [Salvia divinorum]|uniref:Molybdenum cofactor sulfurase-like n=1 Tax=Salvia divinorum TaxID=28513 RepID=A0ABD1HW45_SALDI